MLGAVFVFCAFDGTAASTNVPGELTLHLEPLKAAGKEGEEIGGTVVFVGGAHGTTLTLPMGADPSGIITYRATEVASGRELIGARRDSRSFAADARRSLAAGEKLDLRHDALRFEGTDSAMA